VKIKKPTFYFFIFFLLIGFFTTIAQQNKIEEPEATKLFRKDGIVKIKLDYSNKKLKSETNDSVYLKTTLFALNKEDIWDTLNVSIKGRGNFRLANCYYAPVKMKIKKAQAKGTLFKGNKKLKLVLPCMTEKAANDNVIKEHMAYKIYEHISPYHFKTRLFEADYTEQKGKKTKKHIVKGFFIEDLSRIAKRFECNELERSVHPLQQDGHCSTRNAFFQFMIGNTDFSTGHQHNEKLLFVNKKTVPIPYDFDMSGLVNASYAVVSEIEGNELPINTVRQRLYRGFVRDQAVFDDIRKEFLSKKDEILGTVDSLEPLFENPKTFEASKTYIKEFFSILSNDTKYNRQIVSVARTK